MLTSLAYLGLKSPNHAEWSAFATDSLGGMLAESGPDGAVRVRIDDAAWRIQVHPGEVDDVAYIGWSVDDQSDLDMLAGRLADAGITAQRATPELLAERNVNQMVWFEDPWGFRHELVWGQFFYPSTFRPGRPISGFVTGQQGLGHVVLFMPQPEAGHEFFTKVLGFRLSDRIVGGGLDARFYHCNGRHHSLAIGPSSGDVGMNHLMLQLKSIDDVGNGLDQCLAAGVPVSRTIGRHTNDHMISFYLKTPSSLHIEYGYGGLEIGDDWMPATYNGGSMWGHIPTGQEAAAGPGIARAMR